MDRRLRTMGLPLFAGALAGLAFGQAGQGTPLPGSGGPGTGIVDFQSKLGSFKILSPNSANKAFGKITMSFQGTVLVVGLEGTATPGPGVKVQYDDPKHMRKAFFGRGPLTIDGKWRAIQFFGRDFKGTWDGMGIMRLYGEFDDKLETGTFTVRGMTVEQWGNGGRQVYLPVQISAGRTKAKIEDVKPTPKRPG